MTPSDGSKRPRHTIDADTLRRIDEEARNRSGGDIALWEHHRALLEGEAVAKAHGEQAYRFFILARNLPQYQDAEASVKEGWRLYVEHDLGIPAHRPATRRPAKPSRSNVRESIAYLSKDLQADDYAINVAIVLDAVRSASDDKERSKILHERAQSIHAFAEDGNLDFFRRLGRLLSEPSNSTSQAKYAFTRVLLSEWLTSFLWLMPEKLAADHLALRLGQEPAANATDLGKRLRRFKKSKAGYRLKAHRPSLIKVVTREGGIIPTPEGERRLRSLISSE
jgi:hypothetical protein